MVCHTNVEGGLSLCWCSRNVKVVTSRIIKYSINLSNIAGVCHNHMHSFSTRIDRNIRYIIPNGAKGDVTEQTSAVGPGRAPHANIEHRNTVGLNNAGYLMHGLAHALMWVKGDCDLRNETQSLITLYECHSLNKNSSMLYHSYALAILKKNKNMLSVHACTCTCVHSALAAGMINMATISRGTYTE